MIRVTWSLILLLIVASPGAAAVRESDRDQARAPVQRMGCPAPPLVIGDWITTAPPNAGWLRDRVHAVVVWGAWSKASRQSLPYLSSVQNAFPDVPVICVSSDPPALVREMLSTTGTQPSVRVAVDSNTSTSHAYMQPFNVITIPHAFLVDAKGRIVWHGQPESGLGRAIRQLKAEQLDMDTVSRADAVAELLPQYMELATSATQHVRAREVGHRIIAEGRADPLLLANLARTIVGNRRIQHRDTALALLAAQTAYDASETKTNYLAETLYRTMLRHGQKSEAARFRLRALSNAGGHSARAQLEAAFSECDYLETSAPVRLKQLAPRVN